MKIKRILLTLLLINLFCIAQVRAEDNYNVQNSAEDSGRLNMPQEEKQEGDFSNPNQNQTDEKNQENTQDSKETPINQPNNGQSKQDSPTNNYNYDDDGAAVLQPI